MNIEHENLLRILDIARWAPTVHNTQPWRVSSEGNAIIVKINPEYRLIDGDPTGRETIISLGIFCEALVIGCANEDFEVTDIELQEESAILQIVKAKPPTDTAIELAKLLKTRSTDRSVYKPADIPENLIATLKACNKELNVTIEISQDKSVISKVADLTSKGIALSLSSPSFRKELSRYLVSPGSHKKRGINVKSLYLPPLLTRFEPWLVRSGLARRFERDMERKRWLSSSALVMITAPGDMPKYWLDTGRAYLRLSLSLEKHNFSQATSAAIVEASNYHDDIEEMLGTDFRILALMRIGKGKTKRHSSPRVDPKDLIT